MLSNVWKQLLISGALHVLSMNAMTSSAWGQSAGPSLVAPGARRPATIAERVANSRQSTLTWKQSPDAPIGELPASSGLRTRSDGNPVRHGAGAIDPRAALSALLPPPPKPSVRQNSQILGYTLTPRPIAPKRVQGVTRTAGNAQHVASPSF